MVSRCPRRWAGFEHRTERIVMREGGAEKTGRRMGCMGAKDPTSLSAQALNRTISLRWAASGARGRR